MDGLTRMNEVAEYIENNLENNIDYSALAKMLCCSVYEFSRVFSFVTGVPVSEYIRRRRLSEAALDLQRQKDDAKVIDIALKYRYESQTAFARAFRKMHGITPSRARGHGVALKNYPKLSFSLVIKGVNELTFRIERHSGFKITGLKGRDSDTCDDGGRLTAMWARFMDEYDTRLWNDGKSYYTAPLWQVGAYKFHSEDGKTECIIGAQLRDGETAPAGMDVDDVPAATWAVFTIASPTGIDYVPLAYTRILMEWFPSSGYRRDERVQHLEVFPGGDANSADYKWEIWMPIMT